MTKDRLPYILVAFMLLILVVYDGWKLFVGWPPTRIASLAAPVSTNLAMSGAEVGRSVGLPGGK